MLLLSLLLLLLLLWRLLLLPLLLLLLLLPPSSSLLLSQLPLFLLLLLLLLLLFCFRHYMPVPATHHPSHGQIILDLAMVTSPAHLLRPTGSGLPVGRVRADAAA